MAGTAQISKKKRQSIITLRHEGQPMRKISRKVKVSSSAMRLSRAEIQVGQTFVKTFSTSLNMPMRSAGLGSRLQAF